MALISSDCLSLPPESRWARSVESVKSPSNTISSVLRGRSTGKHRIDELDGVETDGESGRWCFGGEAGIGKSALLANASRPRDRDAGGSRHRHRDRIRAGRSRLHGYCSGVRPPRRPASAAATVRRGEETRSRARGRRQSLAASLGHAEPARRGPPWITRAVHRRRRPVARQRSADALTFVAHRSRPKASRCSQPATIHSGRSPRRACPGCSSPASTRRRRRAALRTSAWPIAARAATGCCQGRSETRLHWRDGQSLTAAQLAGTSLSPIGCRSAWTSSTSSATGCRRQPADTQTLLLGRGSQCNSDDVDLVFRAARSSGVDAGALDAAETAGLVIVSAGALTFRHPLVRRRSIGCATSRRAGPSSSHWPTR